MSRIGRQELKHDEVVETVSESLHFMQAHRDRLILGGIILAVVAVGGFGGYTWYNQRADASNEALGNAFRTFHAPVRAVSLNDAPGDTIFTTDKERQEASLKQFQAVADKYSMMRAGKLARYYIGLCHLNLGQLNEAEQDLTAAMNSSDSLVQPVARLALAQLQARQNKTADAETNLRYMIDHPSESVPKITAQLMLAELLASSKPAEAEKVYKELEAAKPDQDVAFVIQQQRAKLIKPEKPAGETPIAK